ncbi:MAG: rod shape-determining protein MreC [Actinobacteria bacterium]|nr:rod shape-determining protein MreC [Actinomycetota bacterium]
MAQQPLYKRGRSTRLLVVGLVTASLVMITLDYRGGQTGPLEVAGRATLAIISPLQRAMGNVLRPIGDFFGAITHIGSLRAENQELRQDLAELINQQGDELSLTARNDQLERLLVLRDSLDVPVRTGRVIANGVSNFEWVVTINLGTINDIRRGMPVIAPDGLVGHVVKVTRQAADVQLILDPDCSTCRCS